LIKLARARLHFEHSAHVLELSLMDASPYTAATGACLIESKLHSRRSRTERTSNMTWQDWTGWCLAGLTTVAWLGTVAAGVPAIAQGTLRIAMTATDVPTTTGVPNNGFEGVRFMGFTAFDALVNWDLSNPPWIRTDAVST
jgi:hypothetical protein